MRFELTNLACLLLLGCSECAIEGKGVKKSEESLQALHVEQLVLLAACCTMVAERCRVRVIVCFDVLALLLCFRIF